MGVHVGEPLITDEGYTGIDVHRAARLGAAGHGGQILLSATASSPTGFAVRDLGSHRLAGLPEPEHISSASRGRPAARLPAAAQHDRHARERDEGGHRRGLHPAARGRRPAPRASRASRWWPSRTTPTTSSATSRCTSRTWPIVDIRMPPTHTDEGLVAAREIRDALPGHRRARALPVRRARLRGRAAGGGRRGRGLPAQGPRRRSGGVRGCGAAGRRRRLRARSGGREPARRPPPRRRSRSTS